MEAFFLTRGKDDEVATLQKWLSTVCLPLEMTKGTGEKFSQVMECQLRPVQLWSFVFPKEYKDVVVNSLGLYQEGNMFMSGYNINPKLWALRKLLGAKEFTKPLDLNAKLNLPYPRWNNVNLIGIGYREDGEIFEFKHERI